MRVHYCRIPGGNFGDDLNLLLWPELFPDLADRHPDAHLYGVGTLLGGSAPDGMKCVLGSGCGYRGRPALGADWRVYWVRGPRTARACGLDPALGLGDGATLWSGLRRTPAPQRGRIGLIPHHKSFDGADWAAIAGLAGLTCIDSRRSPVEVTDAIAGCERVLTESLHGAIFADALGIPWRAVVLARRFNDFKWQDWLDTLDLTLDAAEAPIELHSTLPAVKALGNRLARMSGYGGAQARNHMRPVRETGESDLARVVHALRGFATDAGRFIVSEPGRRTAQRAAMRERCMAFAQDHGLTFVG
jgi:succinoglycan biosynthesis protein ExoV